MSWELPPIKEYTYGDMISCLSIKFNRIIQFPKLRMPRKKKKMLKKIWGDSWNMFLNDGGIKVIIK